MSDHAKKTIDIVAKFVDEECIPYVPRLSLLILLPCSHPLSADPVIDSQLGEGDEGRWAKHPSVIEELKTKAKALGLWNMFLPKGHYKESPGFSNLDTASWLSTLASRALLPRHSTALPLIRATWRFLAKYGNDAQKAQWLKPLMVGEIRSAFLMTEPQVASSDATNIELNIRRDGNEYVLNGQVSSLAPGSPGLHLAQALTRYEMT